MKIQWNNKRFKALIDSGVIRNHILLKTVKKLDIPYKPKENLYLLIIILGDLIFYKNKVIYIKTKYIELKIKKWKFIINFNILLLEKDKAVLEMP